MEFKFNCPHCNLKLETDDSLKGKAVECPDCNNSITVPDGAKTQENRETNKEQSDSQIPTKEGIGPQHVASKVSEHISKFRTLDPQELVMTPFSFSNSLITQN